MFGDRWSGGRLNLKIHFKNESDGFIHVFVTAFLMSF
jgi:hypothetical protein